MAMMRDKVAGTNGKLARCYVHLGVPDRRHPVIAGRWASSWRPSALGSGVRLLITGSSPPGADQMTAVRHPMQMGDGQ
jgi:hypothetical protein